MGAAVALVKGRTPTEALEILGADCEVGIAAAVEVREWANQQDYWNYGTALEAGTLGDWTIVVELNGFRATNRELLSLLSEGGEAVVIYRNVNALSSFQYARGGQIVREFDPLGDASHDAAFRLPEEEGISFPGDNGELHPMKGAFSLAERLTGIRLSAADLENADQRIAVGLRP